MNFDLSNLKEKFVLGLQELQEDYAFSIGNGLRVFAEEGEAGFSYEGDTLRITYRKECEFYREFLRALRGVTEGKEECAFRRLGIMLDCSRNAVMTVEGVKKLIRLLAVMGYDTLELYMEDVYEVDGEPLFGYLRGRYSKEEMKEIDGYGRTFGVEAVPCIQTLAHLKFITRWPRFIPLVDCADILLAGEEEVYALIEKMLSTLAECFTSRRIHLGMDEANLLGAGQYLKRNGYQDRFDILVNHLKRVLTIAKKFDYECAIWSDLLFSAGQGGDYYAEDGGIPERVIRALPKEVTLTYWDYDHNEQADYEKMLEKHQKAGNRIAFAGGVLKWSNVTAQNRVAILRNEASMGACKKYGVDEVMFTLWGDDGAESSSFSALPALVSAAEFAYGKKDAKEAFAQITGVAFEDFLRLELVSQPMETVGKFYSGNCAKMYLYNDLFAGIFDFTVRDSFKEGFLRSAKKIQEAGARAGKWKYLFDSMYALSALVAEKYDFGVRLRRAYEKGDKAEIGNLADTLPSLLEKLEIYYQAFRRQWDKENKPLGFCTLDIRLGGLKQRWAHCLDVLKRYLAGEIARIPELEEKLIKPYVNFENIEENFTCHQWWQEMVTANFIAL